MADTLAEVLNWVALHCPPSLRPQLLPVLTAIQQSEDYTPAELWRTLAEKLVEAGHIDIAREALKRWQVLAPPDHPLHAVLSGGAPAPASQAPRPTIRTAPPRAGDDTAPAAQFQPPPQFQSPPQPQLQPTKVHAAGMVPDQEALVQMAPPPQQQAAPKPRPTLPFPKREEPNSRIVQVIDTTYTFRRVEAQIETVQGRKVVCGWETYLDEDEKTSRAMLNQFQDGTYAPWAVAGVFSDFAGAAAVEIVVRSMQRHYFFSAKASDKTRKTLVGIVLPATAVLSVLAGYLMGILH